MSYDKNQNKNDLKFSFEDLGVYQKTLIYIDLVYEVTRNFPREEEYRIKAQFIRAAHSIALNVAEGSGGTSRENRNFIRIARRSVRECLVCSTICYRQFLINSETELQFRKMLDEISRMLTGLANSQK